MRRRNIKKFPTTGSYVGPNPKDSVKDEGIEEKLPTNLPEKLHRPRSAPVQVKSDPEDQDSSVPRRSSSQSPQHVVREEVITIKREVIGIEDEETKTKEEDSPFIKQETTNSARIPKFPSQDIQETQKFSVPEDVPPKVQQKSAEEDEVPPPRITYIHIFADKAIKEWRKKGYMRLYPERGEERMKDKETLVYGVSVDTLHLFHNSNSWLSTFEIMAVKVPEFMNHSYLNPPLGGLRAEQGIAVLQKALLEMGYSCLNVVGGLYDGQVVLSGVKPEDLFQGVQLGLQALTREFEAHVQNMMMQSVNPNKTTAERPISPTRMRSPPSIIESDSRSSSEPDIRLYQNQGIQHQKPRNVRDSERKVYDDDPRPRQYSQDSVDRLIQSPFFRKTGLGDGPPSERDDVSMASASSYSVPATQRSARVHLSQSEFPGQSFQHNPSVFHQEAHHPSAATPVFRPFVPHTAIEAFYGTESSSECKSWWLRYQFTADNAGWSEFDRCRNLQLYFKGPAAAWLEQLDWRSQGWDYLKYAFETEFCRTSQSLIERYFSLKQKKNETPRQHLWRLNVAAKKAQMNVVMGEGLEMHISRFIKTINDADIRKAVAAQSFSHLQELEELLKRLESRQQMFRSSGDKLPPKDSGRERSSSVPRSSHNGSSYRTYPEGILSNQGESNDYPSNASKGVTFDTPDSDSEAETEVPASSQVFQTDGRQSRPQQQGSNSGNRSESPSRADIDCRICGKKGHYARECWTKITCEACKGMGHPTEVCWKKCPACQQVHEKGECQVARALADLKSWYKDGQGVKELPASVLQQLN